MVNGATKSVKNLGYAENVNTLPFIKQGQRSGFLVGFNLDGGQ